MDSPRLVGRHFANRPASAMAQDVELAEAVLQIQVDRTGRLGGRAADFRLVEFDALRDIYPHTMLTSGGEALDGPPRRLDDAWNFHLRGACLDITLKCDRGINSLMNGGGHRRVYPPMGRPLVGFFALHHSIQGNPLGFTGTFVNDELQGAVSLEDWARPSIKKPRLKPIKLGIAEMAPGDLQNFESTAIAMGGK